MDTTQPGTTPINPPRPGGTRPGFDPLQISETPCGDWDVAELPDPVNGLHLPPLAPGFFSRGLGCLGVIGTDHFVETVRDNAFWPSNRSHDAITGLLHGLAQVVAIQGFAIVPHVRLD